MEQFQILAIITQVIICMKRLGLKIHHRPAPTVIEGDSWWYSQEHNVLCIGQAEDDDDVVELLAHEIVHWAQPDWIAEYYTPNGEIDVVKWIKTPEEIEAMVVAGCLAHPWLEVALRDIHGAKAFQHKSHYKVAGAIMGILKISSGPSDWDKIARLLPPSHKHEVLRQLRGKRPKKGLTRTERKALKQLRKLLGK